MRQGLGHAIAAPYGMWKGAEPGCHLIAYSPSANDEVTYLLQQLQLVGHLHTVKHLQGHHGSKVRCLLQGGKGMTGGRHLPQLQMRLQGTYHHHLACNIVERHAQQCRLLWLKLQKMAGHLC